MVILKKDKKVDIVFWANLNPNKRGSLRTTFCHLSSVCSSNGVNIVFILGNEVINSVRTVFADSGVDFIPLSLRELNSIGTMVKILKSLRPKIVHFNFIGFGSPLVLICKIMRVDELIITDHNSTHLPAGYIQKCWSIGIAQKAKKALFRRSN